MVSTPDSISSIRKLLDSTQGDDGAAHPHPRQGQIADALDIADVDAVYNAV